MGRIQPCPCSNATDKNDGAAVCKYYSSLLQIVDIPMKRGCWRYLQNKVFLVNSMGVPGGGKGVVMHKKVKFLTQKKRQMAQKGRGVGAFRKKAFLE